MLEREDPLLDLEPEALEREEKLLQELDEPLLDLLEPEVPLLDLLEPEELLLDLLEPE